MMGLSKTSSVLRPRLHLVTSHVLAVPAAVFLSFGLYPVDAAELGLSLVYLPLAMCAVAVLSHQVGQLFYAVGWRNGSSTAFTCTLSCVLTLTAGLTFAAVGVRISFDLLAIFAMAFFVSSSILRAVFVCAADQIRADKQLVSDIPPRPPSHRQAPPKPHESLDNSGIGCPGMTLDCSSLLGRDEVKAVPGEEAKAYVNRVVLISGAGGSVGSELARQVLDCGPRKIVLFELNETALYQIHQAMLLASAGAKIDIVPVLGSVADAPKVRRILHAHQVQVILHAAAYKHVPLVELNPLAGLSNNVLGTQTLVAEAVAAGVERFVLISSDKAVRPINVMGASKRLCELIVQDVARRSEGEGGPIFGIVRFGNVLGSSGSVLPLFQDQVRRGGPVTVTHPEVSRFFMTVQEAVNLVLLAGSLARGGEVFVLDMGKPVRIETLARRVIRGAGLSIRDAANPTGDIEIKFTGLRCGEKMSEELTFSGRHFATHHPKIFMAIEKGLSEFEVAAALRALRHALANDDEADARENACRWVEGIGEATEAAACSPFQPCAHRDSDRFSATNDHSTRMEAGYP